MNVLVSTALRIILFILGFIVTILPRRLELKLGKFIGILFQFFGYRKTVVNDNLRRCFPEKSKEEQTRIAHEHYLNFGMLIIEMLHFISPFKNHYKKYVLKNTKVNGIENYHKALEKNKGCIFVTSHLANWEMMVSAGSMAGIAVTMITKHLKPEWLHQQIESSRSSTGIKPIYEPRTLPGILRALKKNEAIGFAMDQYAGAPIGIPVNFFNVKVGTLSAVATLVKRTGAVVLPALTRRESDGTIVLDVLPELDVSTLIDDEEKTTQAIAAMVEGWVRKYPEYWLWTHRRFKNVVWPTHLA